MLEEEVKFRKEKVYFQSKEKIPSDYSDNCTIYGKLN